MTNYPGAQALNHLHAQADGSKAIITVHLDTLTCQTGVTHFLEKPPPENELVVLPGSADGSIPILRSGATRWVYDKTEDESSKQSAAFWDKIDYALVENESQIKSDRQWEVVDEVKGFGGVQVLKPGQKPTSEQIETTVVRAVLGDGVAEAWEQLKQNLRNHLTRGWWAEVRMVPKLKVMKRMDS